MARYRRERKHSLCRLAHKPKKLGFAAKQHRGVHTSGFDALLSHGHKKSRFAPKRKR